MPAATLTITDDDDPSLLSNITGANSGGTSSFIAQGFTTGAKRAVLTAVRVSFNGHSSDASVKIRKDTTSGCPAGISSCPDYGTGGLVATLSSLTGLSGPGEFTFTPPDGTILEAGTTYWVMIHEGVTATIRKNLDRTAAAATSDAGWTMGARLWRNNDRTDSGGWGSSTDKVKLDIRGTLMLPSTKAT